MSSPTQVTRRSKRSAAASSPPATPVSSHPIKDDLNADGPPSVKKQPKNGSGGNPSGSPPAILMLAVLLVAGGILYNRYTQQQAVGTAAPDVPAPHRSTLEQPEVKAAPPLPSITPEEVAVFEQAAEEHYGLPPGFQAPEFVEEEDQAPIYEVEEFEVGPDPHQYLQGEAEKSAKERPVSHADEEAAEAAAASFDPDVHRQYLGLPPWPKADEDVLTGSWEFSDMVYNYAASLPMAKVLSWDNPRLVVLPSFLSPEEVRHMIKVSKDNLERSEVVVAESEDRLSDIRTSFGFWPDSDNITNAIAERLHRTIGVPQAFGEGLYVLNYQVDQKYEAHNDHCMDGYVGMVAEPACLDFLKRAGGPECGPGKGGPTCGDRVATFIIYLKSPARGGQTAFPEADITKKAMGSEHRSGNSPDEWYCDDERVLAAAPPAGTALLFWDYRPSNGTGTGSFLDGSAQPNAQTVYEAMHSGCPVVEGEKYIATRWIRSTGFDYHTQN